MGKIVYPFLVFALITSLVCCGTNQATIEKDPKEGGSAAATKPRNDIEGLPNFAKVSDTLYRGAQPSAQGFASLKKMGVKTIVNIRTAHSDRDMLEGLGLKYVHISFKPWRPEEEDVIDFLKIVTGPENQPVFVHCRHGADRTGTVVVIYRVAVQGWDLEKAMQELPTFGFHRVWDNLKRYLKEEFRPEEILEKVRVAKMPQIETIP